MLEAQLQHARRGDAATRACRTSIPPPNPIRFTRAICGDLAQAERREWWIANGLGGYAGNLFRRAPTVDGPFSAHMKSSKPTLISRTTSCSTSAFTATMDAGAALRTRPAGPVLWQT